MKFILMIIIIQKNLVDNFQIYRMIILGLNIFHGDAAACIIKDEKIIVAIEERELIELNIHQDFLLNP